MSGETGVEKDSVESKEEEGEREREKGEREGGRGEEDRDEDTRRAKWRREERRGQRETASTPTCVCVRACMCVCKEEWRIEAKGEIHRRWIGRGGHEAATRRASLARFHARNEDERRL